VLRAGPDTRPTGTMSRFRRGPPITTSASASPPQPKVRWRIRRALRELRGRSRHRLGQAAARLIGHRSYADRLDPADVKSVLICRINARMGNALFLTPLLQRIRELLPHAAIDIAIAYPRAADLFERIPGVRSVITFPYKGVSLPWRYAAALRRVRREPYDLAIDPAPDSTSDRVVLLTARARHRLGFATASQWAPLTHAVPLPDATLHQAAQPVYLLSRALAAEWDPQQVRLQLALSAPELATGRAAVERALVAKGWAPSADRVFGLFAHATGHKTIAKGYWRAFWDAFLALEPDAIPFEILPKPHSAPTDARSALLHLASPRALAAAIASMRVFISGDTGPMHLASSTDVPTVALFQASDPALYGPLKAYDLALDLARHSPADVARRCQALWRRAELRGNARSAAP